MAEPLESSVKSPGTGPPAVHGVSVAAVATGTAPMMGVTIASIAATSAT